MRQYICLLLCCSMFASGCMKHKRHHPKPVVPDDDEITVVLTATAIHKQAALTRAGIYDTIADAVRDGKAKTVNDVVDLSTPLFNKAGQEYLDDITKLRKERLHSADDALPQDAEEVFRKFAKEYRAAGK